MHCLLRYAKDWAEFAFSTQRQQRLANISALATAYGITIGVDVGIAIRQQHAMFMTSDVHNLTVGYAQIRTVVDWLMGGKFDYISTESGLRCANFQCVVSKYLPAHK